MADRHVIVVCVEGGEVTDVKFCPCCPAVTVEVQTYVETDHIPSADELRGLSRDKRGAYSTTYYEPDDDCGEAHCASDHSRAGNTTRHSARVTRQRASAGHPLKFFVESKNWR